MTKLLAMSRRVAQGYEQFAVGSSGSLGSPDWRPLGSAQLVGGTDTSCTFRLVGIDDPGAAADVEPRRRLRLGGCRPPEQHSRRDGQRGCPASDRTGDMS